MSRASGPSLRGRIARTCALAIVIALIGMAGAAFLVVRHELYRSLNLELTRQATAAIRAAHGGTEVPSGLCQYLSAPACLQTVSSAGDIDSGGGPRLPVDADVLSVAQHGDPPFYTDVTVDGIPYRMLTTRLGSGYAIQVALRTDQVNQSLARIGIALGVATLIGLAIAIAAGITVARTGLRPLATLTRTAERVAATANPDERITVTGRDEIARLAGSFNAMLAALRAALDSVHRALTVQRRFVADASHELRTPLTALRTNVDLLARADRLDPADRAATIAAARGQVNALSGLVADLIDLARADDPEAPPEEVEPVRADELVARCVRAARRNWPAVTFETDLAPTEWQGAPARLARAIGNLLDNAAKFGPPGSTVRIVLRDNELTVRDHGPGIPADALPHVFDRFYRAPEAHGYPGSGIGLAIVKQVADAHGGTVTVASPPEGGTVFRFRPTP